MPAISLTADEFLEKARSFTEKDGYSFIYDIRRHCMKLAKLPDWDEHPVYVSPDFRTMADKLFHEFIAGIDGKISSMWLKSILEVSDGDERIKSRVQLGDASDPS